MHKLFRTALAVLAVAALASVACNNTSVDSPTSSSVPEPVASASTPPPAASPSPNPAPTPGAGEGEQTKPAWEVECSAVGQMTVKYNGEASHAEVLTYYTSFDGPQQFGQQTKILPTGEQWTRTFPACSQSDAEPISGKPAGHCFFDKNGVPFNSSRNPEKVTECRTPPPPQCEEKWVEDKEPEITLGTFGECSLPEASEATVTGPQCSRSRTDTIRVYETNSCTKARRLKSETTRVVSEPCECADSCENYEPPKFKVDAKLALSNQTATAVTVSVSNPSPAGGSWSPTLPQTVARPAFGQTGKFCSTYSGSVSYGPENLECSTSYEKEFCITLPPQDPPPPQYCFYEVKGQNKQSKCEGRSGTWENWDNEEHKNHCRVPYPGVSNDDFNLAPGQSDNGCLRKQDD